MTLVQIIIIIFTGLSAFFRILEVLAILRTIKTMPFLEKLEAVDIKNPPKLSVIITACNEAQSLEKAMELRLQDNYPNLEFILIDDRSSDGTREIARKIAGKDNRVKLIRIDELPGGWLGKVHAMHRGVKQATGDWFLFSDADVHVKPGTLNRVMAFCRSKNLDQLAIVPEFYKGKFFADTAISVFLKALIAWSRSWKIKDPESTAFGGAGAFNLVRRTAFEKTKGFEWLKLEVIDDLTLGQMIKRTGGRSDMINGRGYVGVRWYSSFREMSIGMGRAVFVGIPNFGVTKLILLSSLTFTLDIIPYIILVPMGIPYLPTAGVVIILLTFLSSIVVSRFTNHPLLPTFLLLVGHIIVFIVSVKSAVTALIKGGIVWRGTFYSTKMLKKGRRFTIF